VCGDNNNNNNNNNNTYSDRDLICHQRARTATATRINNGDVWSLRNVSLRSDQGQAARVDLLGSLGSHRLLQVCHISEWFFRLHRPTPFSSSSSSSSVFVVFVERSYLVQETPFGLVSVELRKMKAVTVNPRGTSLAVRNMYAHRLLTTPPRWRVLDDGVDFEYCNKSTHCIVWSQLEAVYPPSGADSITISTRVKDVLQRRKCGGIPVPPPKLMAQQQQQQHRDDEDKDGASGSDSDSDTACSDIFEKGLSIDMNDSVTPSSSLMSAIRYGGLMMVALIPSPYEQRRSCGTMWRGSKSIHWSSNTPSNALPSKRIPSGSYETLSLFLILSSTI